MPFLEFKDNSDDRASWTMLVPCEWIGGSDIASNIYWSPSSDNTGDVFWFAEYKSVSLGAAVSGTNLTDTYLQAGGGTAYALQNTAQNLTIPGGSIADADLLQITIGRSGKAGTDTFDGIAQVHHVVIEVLQKILQ